MMAGATGEVASRWKRLGGALIDSAISMIITLPIMMVSGVFAQVQNGKPLTASQTIAFFVFGLVSFLIIHGYWLAKEGQTVGKKVVGTRIVSAVDGKILSLGHVFGLRYAPLSVIALIPVMGNIFGLTDSLFVYRKDKRCIHDLIAGTIVVNA